MLKYCKDFWSFYKNNQDEFERIVWKECWKYASELDPEDMHQDLIVRLQRSNFLAEFNPAKSQLITFLTTRVMGYSQHIVTEHRNNVKHMPQCIAEEINENPEDENFSCVELSVNSEIEELIDSDRTEQLIRLKLKALKTKTFYKIFDLLLQGYQTQAIANKLGCSFQNIKMTHSKIKNMVGKMLKERVYA